MQVLRESELVYLIKYLQKNPDFSLERIIYQSIHFPPQLVFECNFEIPR